MLESFLASLRVKTRAFLRSYWFVLIICPALFLYIYSNDINVISIYSLVYRRLCLHHYNRTICDNLTAHFDVMNHVQEMSTREMIYVNMAFLLPAIFAILILSSIGDKRLNYQMPFYISLAGSLIQSFIFIFASDAPDNTVCLLLIYVGQFLNGFLGGGSLCFISSCFSHISIYEDRLNSSNVYNIAQASSSTTNMIEREEPSTDSEQAQASSQNSNRHHKSRSIRYSVCETAILLGQFIGSLSSGYLIGNKRELKNFQKTYIVSFSIYAVVTIYMFFMFLYLKRRDRSQANASPMSLNTSQLLSGHATTSSADASVAPEVDTKPAKSLLVLLKENLVDRFRDNWELVYKKRSRNARFQILLFFLLYFFGASISLGIMQLQFVYLNKQPISFNQTKYGQFKAMNTLFRSASLLIILPIFKYFNAPDYYLYILGITSELLNLVVFSAAYFYKNLIWAAPVVYMFSNYFVVCIRAFASKLVERNETGKFFGVIAVIEFLVLLISSSVFSVIYEKTLAFFPPTVFLVGCAICLVICYPFLIVVIRDYKKHQARSTDADVRLNADSS